MKHLDDSNKEAQEDAEMDAEIELELAQGGLCCMMGNIGAIAGATGGAAGGASVSGIMSSAIQAGTVGSPSGMVSAPLRDGGSGCAARDGHTHRQCQLYSPAQVRRLSLRWGKKKIQEAINGDNICDVKLKPGYTYTVFVIPLNFLPYFFNFT